jgi:type VI secretion system protein ImpD/type VI secretion system protein ImpC
MDNPALSPALRDEVLSGCYFGAAHSDAARRVADFLIRSSADALVAWFGRERVEHLLRSPEALRGVLDRDIAGIDALIGEQLDTVLHHDRLRRLEGSWRGLAWLVQGLDPAGRVKVKLLNIAWPELCRDLERAIEFDQSQMFRKIYEEEFGSPGGEPYGLLVIDHEVRHRPAPRTARDGAPTDDVAALAALASVAAAAFSPTVVAASPALLGVDEFSDLTHVVDLVAPFRGPEYARWRSLATREEMRFVALALPRVLARPPWRDDPARADGFRYAEYAPDRTARVWMNAGYPFAAVVARAFANHAWPADIRGAETDRLGGGVVTDLPIETFRTDPEHVWVRASLDVVLTDAQERALFDAGMMPLAALAFTEEAIFSSVQSLQVAARYIGPTAAAAGASARLSTQVNSMLTVSRFAHYLKMLGREAVGSFQTAGEIERRLQTWLSNYVNSNPRGGSDMRARYPLVSGQVTVAERPGKPGVFGCTILLRPSFQLDDVSATFRLVTELAAPGRQ